MDGQQPQMDSRPVADSFQNMQARLGAGSGNLSDGNSYTLSNLITRQPRTLEFMYRGSWIVGAVVDSVAEDMTRQGVDFGSAIKPGQIDKLHAVEDDLGIWQGLQETIKWGRLYGGAIGVIMIDGQDMATPLRLETIDKDQFLGIKALGRWELMPTVSDMVLNNGPLVGSPEVYLVGPQASAFQMQEIHHSRVMRMEGHQLPYFQRLAESGWGLSVVERMYDRLVAYDSASQGAAQLVFKAYLRVMKVEGLRSILAAGGAAETALEKNIEAIRRFQSSEGLTLIDAKDEFEALTYTFAGLNDLLLGFGQQLSGATQIPLVRLFGQSPAGLNSTGDSDIRNYYDSIKAKQEKDLRAPINKLSYILHRSVLGGDPPDGFRAQFNPCWQMSDTEKGALAKTIGDAVGAAFDDGIIDRATAMRELKQASSETGVFSNITDEAIAEADLDLPDAEDFTAPPGTALSEPGAAVHGPGAEQQELHPDPEG